MRGVLEVGSVNGCRLSFIVDNHGNAGLETAWGLSILAETPSAKILFDGGPDPRILESNLGSLGLDPGEIDLVVVSHGHRDHIGGLSYIARVRPGIKTYVPRGVAGRLSSLGLGVDEVDDTVKIAEGVAVIGWLYGPPVEEALAINVEGIGLVILVGCSHPNVVNIAVKASRDLRMNPYLIVGGFHMGGASSSLCRDVVKLLLSLGLKRIAPIHCSGEYMRMLVRRDFPNNWVDVHVGSVIKIGE